MSKNTKILAPHLIEIVGSIEALLISIKPQIHNGKPKGPSICAELQKLATLAESFTKQRPRSSKDWIDIADMMDREGVTLWNASTRLRDSADKDSHDATATLRLAAFRLIEAGLQQKQPIETLVHILQLASKTAMDLSAIESHDRAASVLTSAAKYEEALRKADDPEKSHTQTRALAIVLYYTSRMEAAWKEGNESLADFMSQKILENDYLALLSARDRELLSVKLLEIGKLLLRPSSQDGGSDARALRARDSVKWLQKAFTVMEQGESVGMAFQSELKRSILRTLARAYFLSSSQVPENLVRAETSLNELISSIDTSEKSTSEYQQLRWMRIAILKRRKASTALFLDAFRSIIDHMVLSESTITDVLQELRSMGQEDVLIASVHQYCIQRVLEAMDKSQQGHIDRLLLSFIFHCSKGADHDKAMHDLAAILTCLTDANVEVSKVSAMACLTLLWQFGDRQYQARRWSEAAEWYMAGVHLAFGSIAESSHPKCFRKAALCYIQQGDYAKATAVIRRCPGEEAATHYVRLLTALHQGFQEDAISAVKAMVRASDFNCNMLLLAIQLANELDMKNVLLVVLEALLDNLEVIDGKGPDVEAITLVRCIVRLVLKLMAEPGADRTHLVAVLVRHFNCAKSLIASISPQNVTKASKDISWLWRTAYNCAVQGCAEWDNAEDSAAQLFDAARQLLEVYGASALSFEADVQTYILNASFAAVVGRVFAVRREVAGEGQQADRLRTVSGDLTACKERIHAMTENNTSFDEEVVSRAMSFLAVLRVFEVELACQLKEWEQLTSVIEEIANSKDLAGSSLEAVADILWVEKDCPINVLFTALEAILHASLDRRSLSIEKFSRWLRAICSMLLSRNTSADRAKAIGYVEQAVHVMENQPTVSGLASEGYPLDERQWLFGTSYNTGIECVHASLFDEAKRWFEAATVICRFLPDGDSRADRISETYSQLLEHYTHGLPLPAA